MNESPAVNTNIESGTPSPVVPIDEPARGLHAERNRANARHSTGPKTEAGKQRSSLNALRHGLTGHTIVLPTEDLAAYQRFTKRFFDDLKPRGVIEEQLVQSIADTSWRLNRIPALENNLLSLGFAEHSDRINTEHPEAHAALAIAEALREQTRAFSALSLHGQRLSRQFERTLQQLRELQEERRRIEQHQLFDAVMLLEMHKDKELTYDPSEDGFVFSNSDIEAFIRRQERLQEARQAKKERCE